MRFQVQFQYKGQGDLRPDDAAEFTLDYEDDDEPPVLPNPGDSVNYTLLGSNQRVQRKVLTKHFSFFQPDQDFCFINIVVTDIDPGEMDARLKE